MYFFFEFLQWRTVSFFRKQAYLIFFLSSLNSKSVIQNFFLRCLLSHINSFSSKTITHVSFCIMHVTNVHFFCTFFTAHPHEYDTWHAHCQMLTHSFLLVYFCAGASKSTTVARTLTACLFLTTRLHFSELQVAGTLQ